ncbi:hypothetical protein GY45DRAFT_323623 [Cubamyces sp. BRFM 1775]|nr:hypothetical protein GY45DRAFT_323623 [Cubamyces sp. BRFM 1775]
MPAPAVPSPSSPFALSLSPPFRLPSVQARANDVSACSRPVRVRASQLVLAARSSYLVPCRISHLVSPSESAPCRMSPNLPPPPARSPTPLSRTMDGTSMAARRRNRARTLTLLACARFELILGTPSSPGLSLAEIRVENHGGGTCMACVRACTHLLVVSAEYPSRSLPATLHMHRWSGWERRASRRAGRGHCDRLTDCLTSSNLRSCWVLEAQLL